MQRFIVEVEGPNIDSFEEIELPAAPKAGEPIETRFGTCLVTALEDMPDGAYAGRIVCRIP